MEKSRDAFRTISEVADWLGTPTHVLRFWESRFTQVKPVKRAGGRRYYRPADMLLLGGIKQLLHEDGMTIRGVQKLLREHGVKHVAALSPPLDFVHDEGEAPIVGDYDEAPMHVDAPQAPYDEAPRDNVVPLNRAEPPAPPEPEPEPEPETFAEVAPDDVSEPEDTADAAPEEEPEFFPPDAPEPQDAQPQPTQPPGLFDQTTDPWEKVGAPEEDAAPDASEAEAEPEAAPEPEREPAEVSEASEASEAAAPPAPAPAPTIVAPDLPDDPEDDADLPAPSGPTPAELRGLLRRHGAQADPARLAALHTRLAALRARL